MKKHLVTAVGLTWIVVAALAQARPAENSTGPDSDAPWRVEDAHGATRDITFTTDEGTWLSLDVHPDGRAAAPTVSPDGQTIAFTRRVRARARIELLDVATGRLRTLASNVQRDNQQGFAFHGVLPGFAWTPDGASLVATAEGRLWRWDVETGARSPVPFEAAVQQRVAETLRAPPGWPRSE